MDSLKITSLMEHFSNYPEPTHTLDFITNQDFFEKLNEFTQDAQALYFELDEDSGQTRVYIHTWDDSFIMALAPNEDYAGMFAFHNWA